MIKADNAVILAGGAGARFAPLSYEKPKGLIEVKGEPMIERQIRQLKEAGIKQIYLVTGYKQEQLNYLAKKEGVDLIDNPGYAMQNSAASIWLARDVIKNSFICAADNYFLHNPFKQGLEDQGSYYAAQYSPGLSSEWGVKLDEAGFIKQVTIGTRASWYLLGHAFWTEDFARRFFAILSKERTKAQTHAKFWEEILAENLDQLKMRLAKFPAGVIQEFDSLDDLRQFDHSYVNDSRSRILKKCAKRLGTTESCLDRIKAIKGRGNEAIGFHFRYNGQIFCYLYQLGEIIKCRRLGHPY